MNALRLAAIILPMAFLIACSTSKTILSIEKGPTTPLHRAAADGEPEAVTLLLDGGAEIEARNENGGTPLHVAVENNEPEVVALLLDRGAPPDALADGGFAPLYYAEKNELLKGSSVLERLKVTQE